LLLGSASPRRRELLALAGVPFVVRSADADEAQRPGEPPDEYARRVTRAKLQAVRARWAGEPASAILVADTIVVAPGGVVLGKPAGGAAARDALVRLSDTTHEVVTRFVLAETEGDAAHEESVVTQVTFRALTEDELTAYVALGEGRDKAGGYAVQGRAAVFVSRIDGSYTNVMGLPLCEVAVALRRLGWWSGA
jgi:septum formation protein